MQDVLAWIVLLSAGGLIVIAPLFIMMVYKSWKENPDDIASTQKETQ